MRADPSGRIPLPVRALGELVIIVLGVLIALARRLDIADRGLRAADRLMELRRDPGDCLGGLPGGVVPPGRLRRQLPDSRPHVSGDSSEFFTDYYKTEEMAYYDLLAARLDTNDFEAITRSEDGAGRLSPARLLARLRADDEIANAILMNRH